MKTYDVVAAAIKAQETGHCFALLGDGNMHFAGALSHLGMSFTYARHEHCAVSMAMAYARVTGGPGLATVTCGPGLTQVMTGLAAAVRARIPLVLFVGESPLRNSWYNQEIDQAPFVTACGAEYVRILHKPRITRQIQDTFARTQMTGIPVVIGMPFDLQESDWGDLAYKVEKAADLIPAAGKMFPDPANVTSIAAMVAAAEKPVIIGGRGAILADAGPSCIRLADHIGAVLLTTLPARGLFHQSAHSLNVVGGFASDTAREACLDADLIIAVGTSLASHSADAGKLYPNAKILHIDTKPVIYSQGRVAAHIHLCADAKIGVDALINEIETGHGASAADNSWRNALVAKQDAAEYPDAMPFQVAPDVLDPRAMIKALDQKLPKDWFMVNSSGHCSYYAAHMTGRSSDVFLTIREFGAIGNGLSYAIGVAAARPETQVVLIDGDGGFLMHAQELETLARHGIKLLMIVMNDAAYGSEIHKLRVDGHDEDGAAFGATDLASMARGFGLGGVSFRNLDHLDTAFDEFIASDKAALWDFHISDQVVSPVMRRLTAAKK
ncbi:MAG: thiamine pyrophosphate-binding protein [Candidatus Puniceispirillaceae bacterium]